MEYIDGILLLLLTFSCMVFKTEVVTVAEWVIPIVIFIDLLYLFISRFKSNRIWIIKYFLIIVIFFLIVIKSYHSAVNQRQLHPSSYPVHDSIIQVEQASRYILNFKNPYSYTYQNLGMERTWKENPSVYNLIYLPFYLIFSAIIMYIFNISGLYFDQRFVHLIVFLPVIPLLFKLKKNNQMFASLLIVFLFNAFLFQFFIAGRNDIFVFSLLFYFFYALLNKKNILATVILGLACASKQTAWVMIPLYFCFMLFRYRLKTATLHCLLIFIIMAIFFSPFLFSDSRGFINGIYNYPAGTLKTSFPIMGYGFSWFLVQMHILDWRDYFPFWIFQLISCVPVLTWCVFRLQRETKVECLIQLFGFLLFTFWFFSRFFNDNYVGFVISVFIIAEIFRIKETKAKI